MAHPAKFDPNTSHRKAVRLFSKHLKVGKPFNIEDVLLEAGFAESTAKQQTMVMKRIREELKPVIEELEDHRGDVIIAMHEKLKTASYADLVRSLDTTTKNIQLLGGKPTEIVAVVAEVRHKLDALFVE